MGLQMTGLVLFDLDGTLIDDETASAEAVERWLVPAGMATAERIPDLARTWRDVAERHFPAFRAGTTTFQGQRRLRLKDFLPYVGTDPSHWSDERLDATFDAYLAEYEKAWRPFPDTIPCLTALRPDVRIAVLSNGDQSQQEHKLRRTGLAEHIDVVLTSSRLGVAKPDPAVFRLACAELGASPATTMYVGDRLDVDAIASSQAGLRGIWLNRNEAHCPEGVGSITSLDGLPRLLSS